jgi:hypothetical protein
VTCDYCQRHPEKWVAQLKAEDAAALAATENARLALARKLGVEKHSRQLLFISRGKWIGWNWTALA